MCFVWVSGSVFALSALAFLGVVFWFEGCRSDGEERREGGGVHV
jgi:hypothetical protein